MSSQHPDLNTLERFAALDLATGVMLETGRHVVTCTTCRRRMRKEVVGGEEILRRLAERFPACSGQEYDPIFMRIELTAAKRLHRVREEHEQAGQLLTELETLPIERRLDFVCSMPRFHNSSLTALLLDRCREISKEDPVAGEEIAGVALAIADRLDPSFHGPGLQNDLRARAWAFIGNARRIQYDLRGAAMAFENAEEFLDEGSTDPQEVAQVLDLKTSLLRAQRRLDEALEVIQDVVRLYRRIGDRHLEGRALVSQALIHGYAGEPEKGIALFARAVQRIDSRKEPHLFYTAYHNLVADLIETGRLQEASDLFPEVRRSATGIASPVDMVRILWAEAMIDAGFGRHEEAETKFQQVREQFIGLGSGYDTALVSLDLARIYLLQGRTAEAKRVAAEMHALFASREIHREALATLIVFQRAVEQDAATVRMVDEVSRYLKRTHSHPDMHQTEHPA